MGALLIPLQALGRYAEAFVADSWRLLRFSLGALTALSRFLGHQGFRAAARVTMQQVYFTGLEALPFLALLSLLLGSTVIVQALPQLQDVGATGLVGKILVIVIVRELGPIVTAMVVITRSGTAMAAEMATNRITGQVEALEAMGIDIFHYLIAPRILGTTLAVFLYDCRFRCGGSYRWLSRRQHSPDDALLDVSANDCCNPRTPRPIHQSQQGTPLWPRD
jgi:ABC-type transporter Mla maintaining outer membrane lipid asymmetry permease subunit MlaE